MSSLNTGTSFHPEYKFLEELIDACIMEIYFYNHMSERDLLFNDETSALLVKYSSEEPVIKQQEFLKSFYKTANAPDHPIHNRLMRITTDSPDILAVIKGKSNA